jgi:aspartyl-tRNA(Asn)/glutamyl-tRNA(Gln) amidotransferase subunit C
MAMTSDDVKALAFLARLELSPDEMARMTEQLSKILDFADHLLTLPVDAVEPLAHPIDMVSVWRDDQLGSTLSVSEALQNAPQKQFDREQGPGHGFFLVPPVLE